MNEPAVGIILYVILWQGAKHKMIKVSNMIPRLCVKREIILRQGAKHEPT